MGLCRPAPPSRPARRWIWRITALRVGQPAAALHDRVRAPDCADALVAVPTRHSATERQQPVSKRRRSPLRWLLPKRSLGRATEESRQRVRWCTSKRRRFTMPAYSARSSADRRERTSERAKHRSRPHDQSRRGPRKQLELSSENDARTGSARRRSLRMRADAANTPPTARRDG